MKMRPPARVPRFFSLCANKEKARERLKGRSYDRALCFHRADCTAPARTPLASYSSPVYRCSAYSGAVLGAVAVVAGAQLSRRLSCVHAELG